jgi:hypothetical protein
MPQPDSGATVEIVVQLAPEAPAAPVQRIAAEVGAVLQPLHPATSDPGLARYAVVRVPAGQADDLADRLNSSPSVDAAYVKPAGEAP